jgi:hypothetical protein
MSLTENLNQGVGSVLLHEAENKVKELLNSENNPLRKQILELLLSSLENNGLEGINIVNSFLKNISEAKAVDFTGLDLIVASDVLATMQKSEAAHNQAVLNFLTELSQVLGVIISLTLKNYFIK